MQLGGSNSKDLTTLKGLTRFYANTLNNTTDFTDAMIIALLNQAYRRVELMLLTKTFNFWEKSTLEGDGNGLINLTAGTQAYTLITDILTVSRVEVNYTGEVNGWVKAEPIILDAIRSGAVANASSTFAVKGSKSRPVYWIRDNNIYIDPIPDVSVTDGLKVWCSTQITDLSGDTDEPVILEAYHPLLCRHAAAQYAAQRTKMDTAKENMAQAQLLEQEMLSTYFKRNKDRYHSIRLKAKKNQYK